MVRIVNNNNFQLHFNNCYVVSVNCGYDYGGSDNRSETVEVAIWLELEGERIWKTSDLLDTTKNVMFGITADELADIIIKVKEME